MLANRTLPSDQFIKHDDIIHTSAERSTFNVERALTRALVLFFDNHNYSRRFLR